MRSAALAFVFPGLLWLLAIAVVFAQTPRYCFGLLITDAPEGMARGQYLQRINQIATFIEGVSCKTAQGERNDCDYFRLAGVSPVILTGLVFAINGGFDPRLAYHLLSENREVAATNLGGYTFENQLLTEDQMKARLRTLAFDKGCDHIWWIDRTTTIPIPLDLRNFESLVV